MDVSAGVIGHRLWFGHAAYSRTRTAGDWTAPEWTRFETRKAFWDWVDAHTAPKRCTYLFCHNTGFDLPVMDIFRELPRRGWKMTRAVLDAPPTIITFRRAGARIEVLDTLNIWRMPLAKLGAMVGLPKLDMPAPTAPAGEWQTYARRDVEILWKACMEWWAWLRGEDMGSFAPTLAAQALRTWRHRYMDERVLVHDTADLLTMEREAYHGGRVECFRLGRYTGRFHVLDVNSLYPAVMQYGTYPARVAFRRKNAAGFPWTRYTNEYCTIARVELQTDQAAYPVMSDGKLIFPVGRYPATLCGPELLYAHEHGHITRMIEVALYERAPIFRQFVDDLYRRRVVARRAGDDTRSHFIKIMMNSLYGKFGQRGDTWAEHEWVEDLTARRWKEVDAETGNVVMYRQLGGLVQRQSSEPESRESCPAIAAYVTSYARMHLWRLMQLAGRDNLYYVDTDSLLVTDAGRRRLKAETDPDAIGKLKLETSTDRIELYGPKDYVIGDKRKHKGVRANAEWLDATTVRQERWRGLKGQIADGILDQPTTATITKRLKRNYTKGRVGRTGRVHPLELDAGG